MRRLAELEAAGVLTRTREAARTTTGIVSTACWLKPSSGLPATIGLRRSSRQFGRWRRAGCANAS